MHSKFHLDPSNRMATVHKRQLQTDRQDRTDRQRSDSIARTVLQTVAQKFIKKDAVMAKISLTHKGTTRKLQQRNIDKCITTCITKQKICADRKTLVNCRQQLTMRYMR